MKTIIEIKETVVRDSLNIINPSQRKLVEYGFNMGFEVAQQKVLIDALKEIEFLIANSEIDKAYILAQETIDKVNHETI